MKEEVKPPVLSYGKASYGKATHRETEWPLYVVASGFFMLGAMVVAIGGEGWVRYVFPVVATTAAWVVAVLGVNRYPRSLFCALAFAFNFFASIVTGLFLLG